MKWIYPAMLLALVAGCGGSGGSDGGGTGTGFSAGVVTEVGSARVAGTFWTFDGDTVFEPGSLAGNIERGQVLRIEGTLGTDNVATRVVRDDILQGVVVNPMAVPPAEAGQVEFTILGLRVVMSDDSTQFSGTSFAGILGGETVAISGFEGPDGIVATFIEDIGASDARFRGAIENLDLGAETFEIGDIAVRFSTAAAGMVDEIEDGDFVEVSGTETGLTSVDASEVRLRPQGIDDEGDVAGVTIEGVVTDFMGPGSFRVGGQLVSTFVQGIVFEPTASGFLGSGARVEVKGSISSGVLLANQVRLREDEIRLEASGVSDIVEEEGTFMLAGVPFSTDETTNFGPGDPSLTGLDDLAMCGTSLAIRGLLIDDAVRATVIECVPTVAAVTLQSRELGFDSGLGFFRLQGLDQNIPTASATFQGFDGVGPNDEAAFYNFLFANQGELIRVIDDGASLTGLGTVVTIERAEPAD